MRKTLFTIAAAASALAVAAPASAQWYPQVQSHPYGNQYSQQRSGMHQARLSQLQRQIREFDRRNIISDREARWLFQEARNVQRNLHAAARHGLSRYEDRMIRQRIARLEMQIQRAATNGQRYGQYGNYGNPAYYGNNGAYQNYGNYDRRDRRDRDDDDRWDD